MEYILDLILLPRQDRIVSATSYIPDDLRVVEIESTLENLLIAHRGFNNFHNEPPFARELQRLVGHEGKIPAQIDRFYVLGLVEVFLTNGHGVAVNAEPIYRSLIGLFDSTQALRAVLSFNDDNIASSLQFSLCVKKYRELMRMMRVKVSSAVVKELIDDIEGYQGSLDIMRENKDIRRKVAILQRILG